LREQLTARGATSIRGLGRSFKLFDSYNGNRKVDSQEFFVGLQENGVKITKAEADVSSGKNENRHFIFDKKHNFYRIFVRH
jgi:hypothetical protein